MKREFDDYLKDPRFKKFVSAVSPSAKEAIKVFSFPDLSVILELLFQIFLLLKELGCFKAARVTARVKSVMEHFSVLEREKMLNEILEDLKNKQGMTVKKSLLILALLAPISVAFAGDPVPVKTYTVKKYERKFYTGLRKEPKEVSTKRVPVTTFHEADVKLPKKFNIAQIAKLPLMGIYNQASCGSCVYNSVGKNFTDSLRIRGINAPVTSRQYLMDRYEWSCSGSFASKVMGGLVQSGGAAPESEYAYRARDQRPIQFNGELIKPIVSWKEISNTPKSIMTALYQGYPVSVTVGADNTWSGYGSGIYNRCTNAGTNHQVLIYGWDCEDSVDSEGNCKFDASGKLPAGVGVWDMPNSWGESWGEEGVMRTKITSTSGRLCNNLAEEATILETGIPFIPEDKSVSCELKLDKSEVKVGDSVSAVLSTKNAASAKVVAFATEYALPASGGTANVLARSEGVTKVVGTVVGALGTASCEAALTVTAGPGPGPDGEGFNWKLILGIVVGAALLALGVFLGRRSK